MFIAHLPAGYLVTKGLESVLPVDSLQKIRRKWLMFAGLLGSMLPDFDMVYFHLIDHRQHLHHGYWSHIPFFWVCVFIAWGALAVVLRRPVMGLYGIVVSVNVLVHLFLDTVVGKVRWLFPYSTRDIVLFHVPAVHDWWVWNFVLHWTFLFEIAIVVCAIYVLIRSCRASDRCGTLSVEPGNLSCRENTAVSKQCITDS